MKEYFAQVDHAGQLIDVRFTTDGSPIQYLWERYGMSSYIASLIDASETKAASMLSSDGLESAATVGREPIIDKNNP